MVYIIAPRRSGIHAIESWLLPALPGLTNLVRDIQSDYTTPYTILHNKGATEIGQSLRLVNCHNILVDIQDKCDPTNFMHKFYTQELTIRNLVVGEHCEYDKVARNTIVIFVLRDALNMFASRIKLFCGAEKPDRYPPNIIEIWRQIALAYLGKTDPFRLYNKKIHPVIIYYNKWFVNPNYRRRIMQGLGLISTDAGLNTVRSDGGGSSFDRITYNNAAQKMNVLNRWHYFQNDNRLKNIFRQNPELVKLQTELEGNFPLKL